MRVERIFFAHASSSRGAAGRQTNIRRRLGVSSAPFGRIRSGDGNLGNRRSDTGMTPLVEVRLEGLARRLEQR